MRTDTELLETVAKLGLTIDQSHPGVTLVRTPVRGALRGLVCEAIVQGPGDYVNALRRAIDHCADLRPAPCATMTAHCATLAALLCEPPP